MNRKAMWDKVSADIKAEALEVHQGNRNHPIAVAERARIVAILKGVRDSYPRSQNAERNAIETALDLVELT